MMEKEEEVERSREHCRMDGNSDYEEPDDSERIYVNLKVAENEVPQPQTVRFCLGRLARVSKDLLQLLTFLGLFLLFVFILVQVSRIHQTLQSWPGAHQRNQSSERLCRACPWGWEHVQGSCYLYSRSAGDWFHAVSACQHTNSQLVIVNSAPEEKFLQFWEVQKNGLWIGLSDHHDEGSWQWIDGSPLNISFWSPGEPNDSDNEDCVQVLWYGWNDWKCQSELPWVCEKSATPCPEI